LDEKQKPPATLAKCKVCNGYTSLLLQLNADLQTHFPQDDRRLHLYCCRKKTCSKKPGSIRALREVRKPAIRNKAKSQTPRNPMANTQQQTQDLGSALFGGPSTAQAGANPFSMSTTSTGQTNPFSTLPPPSTLAALPPQKPGNEPEAPTETFADKLKISTDSSKGVERKAPTPQEPWPEDSDLPTPYTRYYLDADAEELEPEDKSATPATSSKTQYDADDSSSNALGKDTFESSLDKTFQKFSDRIAQNPEQVLRYEFKGQPLLYSGHDDVATRFVVPHGKAGAIRGIPRCEKCGGQRVFELQLVPGLIYELEKDEATDLEEGMEWGTIIIGTCATNCGEPGQVSFREEWVGVQWEERTAKK
jgi:pre-rRNA-processing protein TSR4